MSKDLSMIAETRHPVEFIEPAEPSAATREEAKQLFAEVVLPCLPSAGYGRMRRFQAGYNRWVVTCYRASPEWFAGVNKVELAAFLGLTFRALMLEFQHVDALLGKKSGPKSRQKLPGPPPGSPPRRGSARCRTLPMCDARKKRFTVNRFTPVKFYKFMSSNSEYVKNLAGDPAREDSAQSPVSAGSNIYQSLPFFTLFINSSDKNTAVLAVLMRI